MDRSERVEINDLLRLLAEFEVVKLVSEHYDRYGNRAPAALLAQHIQKVEQLVEAAYETTDSPVAQAAKKGFGEGTR